MELSKPKQKAIAALKAAREKGHKWRVISEKTGVATASMCNIISGVYPFSEEVAFKIIDGCKALGRKP